MIGRSRKYIFDFHNTNSLLIKTIAFIVFFISIGYSALNSSLMVTGDLVYRTKEDIRITGVRINGVTNGGIEQYSPKYTKNTVSFGMKLPNLNSTVTYEVTIKNSSSDKYLISSITDETPGNPNISYTHNYANTIIEANSTITVLLTYKYNSDVTLLPESLFKETKVVIVFEEAANTLYRRMKLDYQSGKAELYTGDKSTFIGNKEVYYYKGETLNNNVIFAGFCWKMYRTTETGGVKMIYNGVPASGQCTSTGSASTIGNSAFNSTINSPANVGYMYNKRYTYNSKFLSDEGTISPSIIDLTQSEYNIISNASANPYTFDTTTNKWTSNNHDHSTTSTIEFSVKTAGEYYFNYTVSSESGYDKGTIYVDGVQKGQYSGETSSSLSLGTLTTSNVVKVVYSKDGSVSKGTDNIVFSVSKPSDSTVDNRWKYGNSFTYSGGTYTLTNQKPATLSTEASSLSNNHYTCWNTAGTCTTLSYVYYVDSSSSFAYYINLTGGTSIEQALNEMLYDDNVNTTNSTMKTKIDTWYKNNMTGYTSYLEDAIWCNDRSMNNQSTNGWNPNGGSMTTYLIFKSEENENNLTCQDKNNRFTVSSTNGNGKLTYPVGLVTRQEQNLAYYSNNSPIKNGDSFWTLSPRYFGNYAAHGWSIDSDGDWFSNAVDYSYGARPAVSLKTGIEYSSGDGTITSPFKIETPDVTPVDRRLYQRVKSNYESGGNVELYTGNKSTFIGDKDVYYYKGATANNNVIFAGFCWKMYRTTETGGVKMIYNGVPSSGQCTSTGSASTIGSSTFNSSYNSPAYVGYMYNKVYTYNSKSLSSIPSYLYGNSFTYSGGTYTLTNTQSVTLSDSTVSNLTSKHYTCWNTSGTCTTVSYVYYVYSSTAYYINLTGGTSIEKALNEMLYDDNVNTTNSTIKTTIDTWYQNNMTGYTSYLEDAIWCNDRSMNNQSANGWNPNGGSMTTYLYFKSYGDTTNLTCQNKNDRFTVSSTNGNGKLTYPVGLVTRQEQNLAYYSSNSPIQNGDYFWTLSPRNFDSNGANGFGVNSDGDGTPAVSMSRAAPGRQFHFTQALSIVVEMVLVRLHF